MTSATSGLTFAGVAEIINAPPPAGEAKPIRRLGMRRTALRTVLDFNPTAFGSVTEEGDGRSECVIVEIVDGGAKVLPWEV